MPEKEESIEKERLIKLWKAYEEQEKEYSEALKKILTQEKEILKANKMIASMRKLIEDKNKELMELELKNTSLQNDLDEVHPKLQERNSLLEKSNKRYAQLYALTEELEEELEEAKKQISARDMWFERNFSTMDEFRKSLNERQHLLDKVAQGESITSSKTMLELKKIEEEAEKEELEPEEEVTVEEKKPEVDTPSLEDELEGSLDLFGDKDEELEEVPPLNSAHIIQELCKLDSINPTRAKALIAKGFDTLNKIRKASTDELLEVEGFDELLIESLRIDLLE